VKAKLVVKTGTPCHFCRHPRSSHSELVLSAKCKADGCDCPVFDPICGCGHMLSEHLWSTAPDPWGCAFCVCMRFGADMSGTVERKDHFTLTLAPKPKPPAPKPVPEVYAVTNDKGDQLQWGRRDLALFDCSAKGCPEQATYWASRSYFGRSGKWTTARTTYCGPHFRRWHHKHYPPTQLALFEPEAVSAGS
jgi:hypothetical protein